MESLEPHREVKMSREKYNTIIRSTAQDEIVIQWMQDNDLTFGQDVDVIDENTDEQIATISTNEEDFGTVISTPDD